MRTNPARRALALLAALSLGCSSASEVPDPTIAIVGAGASGLMAAHTLARLGYTHVTVFEQNDRVGGKVHSAGGDLPVELGAYYVAPQEVGGVVLALADELGVRYVPDSQSKFIVDANGVARSYEEHLLNTYSPEEIAAATENYVKALETFAPARASYANLHPDLTMPFDAFAKKHGFTPIAQLARSWIIGWGYGYYENVPAAYFMRLIETIVPVEAGSVKQPRYLIFPRPEGFQALWKAVAEPLDVRLSSEVTHISRSPEPGPGSIVLTINREQQLRFDRLIISAPLSAVPGFLDVTDEERDLFERVQSNRFFVTFFATTGLLSRDAWFHDHNATLDRINHVGSWGDTGLRREISPNWAVPVFVAYQIAEWDTTPEAVTETLRSDVAAAGGLLAEVLLQTEWSYFPHVSGDDLAEGFYDRVEALQGRLETYYVGSALSFETVEHTAVYARDLILAHFQDRRP